MEPLSIPLTANWNLVSSSAPTPDGGFLYIGFKSVNYISKIEDGKNPLIKAIFTRQKIKSIDCDPDWSQSKYFAALADDNTIQVWDVNDGKAKKGHKGHIKTAIGDGDGHPSDCVAMCFLQNRTVLSINSSCLISYCIQSNRFSKNKRIIPTRHKINIIKGSPIDENIVAMGTARGLVLIVNLKSEEIIYRFSGHSREITSLSWNVLTQSADPSKTPKRKPSRRRVVHDTTADEIFDIYDYDYLENEFGAPAHAGVSSIASDTESVENGAKDALDNANFNFVEACKSLKDDILALKNDNLSDSVSGREKQVTLKDCEQSIKTKTDGSLECDSDASVEFLNSSDESFLDESRNNCPMNESRASVENLSPEVYLATASADGDVWIWNTKTGESIDRIQLKGSSHGQHANYTEVCWLNGNTIIMNDRSCELVVYVASPQADKKLKFKQEKYDSAQRGVVGVCKLKNMEIIWTISSYRELVCQDIVAKKILAKFSCAITGVSAIRERPDNMNQIAFAFPDRRIALMALGNISASSIPMENFTLKDDSQIISLSWCPNDRFLAFGTAEGRVGVVDTEKSSNAFVLMKPFTGKPVYSLDWCENKIFVCSHEKVAYYEWNGKIQHAVKLENIGQASSIALHGNYLIVGAQNGDVVLYERSTAQSMDYKRKTYVHVSPKYISEISFNPINPALIAVSSLSNDLTVIRLTESKLEVERVLTTKDFGSGNTWVKWSNKNENLLLSCGFDGTVRIWDLSRPKQNELLFLKQFDSPMLCAIFSPINEDIIICAGKATSIEMFDYKNGVSSVVNRVSSKKTKDKPLGAVQWGTRLELSCSGSKKKTKKQNNVDLRIDSENLDLIEKLKQVKLEDISIVNDADSISGNILKQTQPTVLHLSTREFNKDTVKNILQVLNAASESDENMILSRKLFGSREDVEQLLNDELKNHQTSNTKSIGRILIPQIQGNLKEEIIECIKTKKLNEIHVSLAPTISYDFWKNCCMAYACQLLELGLSLSATPYLLACHEVKECIDHLLDRHYYREAWVIAKVYRESKDPILDTVLTKWIGYLESNGNLEGATLLCSLNGKFDLAFDILSKRRQLSHDQYKVLHLLSTKRS